MPHSLINTPALIGPSGETFFDHVLWVAKRVAIRSDESYRPTLHFDVYGGLGNAFDNDIDAMALYLSDLEAALALLAGVLGARSSGKGRDLDVSLFDVALHNLSYLATWHLNKGVNPARAPRSSHHWLAPSQLYRTKDGWIFLTCNKEKFWVRLTNKIGRPVLAADPEFASYAQRLANRDKLTAVLDEALGLRTTAKWLEILGGSVPAAAVNDVAEALANPFAREQGRVAEFAAPDGGSLDMLACPIRLADEATPGSAGPTLGMDSELILGQLGYGEEEIRDLRRQRVI